MHTQILNINTNNNHFDSVEEFDAFVASALAIKGLIDPLTERKASGAFLGSTRTLVSSNHIEIRRNWRSHDDLFEYNTFLAQGAGENASSFFTSLGWTIAHSGIDS